MNGTYLEYFCVGCGWFPSIKITDESEESVKKILEQRVVEHKDKCIEELP